MKKEFIEIETVFTFFTKEQVLTASSDGFETPLDEVIDW